MINKFNFTSLQREEVNLGFNKENQVIFLQLLILGLNLQSLINYTS